MPIFMRSGQDPQLLNAIWHLADHNKDGKLSVHEFAVAFHLILCVGKKHLPLPPGLPPPLLAMVSAPAPVVHVKQSVGDAFGDLGGDEDNLSVGSVGLGSFGGASAGLAHAPAPAAPVVHSAPMPAQHMPAAPAAQHAYVPSRPPSGASAGSDKEHVRD
jgi:hypothetical protein